MFYKTDKKAKTVCFASILALVTACGNKEILPQNPAPISADEVQPVEMSRVEEDNFQITEIIVPPENVGGPWKRQFQFVGKDVARFTVESRHSTDESWKPIGYTNSDGLFEHADIAVPTYYRFAEQYESELKPAYFDAVVNADCAGGAEVVYQAYRVVIPSTRYIANCTLKIFATEVLGLGDIRAYPPGTLGGQSAGTLIVVADTFTSSGGIYLTGQAGFHGANGHNGAPHLRPGGGGGRLDLNGKTGNPGGDGSSGQAGGNGGKVIMSLAVAPTMLIDVSGAPGGIAGVGGAGGLGGKHDCTTVHRGGRHTDYEQYVCGVDGQAGPNGNNGSAGAHGAAGEVQTLIRD